jgi:hypothetical protein
VTAIQWDQAGERKYETGVDRGVLYTMEGIGIPWNGLVSVTENLGRDVSAYFLDGDKYLQQPVMGTYSGTMQAFTYPSQLDDYMGNYPQVGGIRVHDQMPFPISVSYRTLLGDDLKGISAGYRLHILYNVLAMPSNIARGTLAGSVQAEPFEWSLAATPAAYSGLRSTAHISLQSNEIDPALLRIIENRLYGTADADPMIPYLDEMLAIADAFINPPPPDEEPPPE